MEINNISNNLNNMEKIPFFVYGTLMKNFKNHKHIFKNLKDIQIKKAELEQATLYHFEMGFPGVYKSNILNQEKNETVKGELIFLDKVKEEAYNKLIQNLDFLEGFTEEKKPDFDYFRELTQVKVFVNEGSSAKFEFIEAWVYWCNLDLNFYKNIKIENGDWRKFMEDEDNLNLYGAKEDDSGPPKFD